MLADLVFAGAHELGVLEFDVADHTALPAQAYQQAVATAREKAALCASAAGVRLGAVLHIEDADAQPVSVALASAEELAPGEIVVSASVRVGYALTRE